MTTWITVPDAVDCKEVHGSALETYNAISGNPEYRVRLEVPFAQRSLAISQLLGGVQGTAPSRWPHTTVFETVVATSISVVNDRSSYTTDGDAELLTYQGNSLLDIVYTARTGVYGYDYNGKDVYWDDVLEPRTELIPIEPKMFIWGGDDENVIPADEQNPRQDELPNRIEPGQTLYHTIEGWPRDFITGIDSYIGTTHNADYTSPILKRTFLAETLMLRSYTIQQGFSFTSYRQPTGGAEDPSGKATQTLKLVYEYKPDGWNLFLRYDPMQNTRTKQFLRYAGGSKDVAEIIPSITHNVFLGGFFAY